MLTAIALSIGGVKDECWKQKNSVNEFYHNILAHFIFIYLQTTDNVLEQINQIISEIDNGKVDEVIERLKQAKQELVLKIEDSDSRIIVTNPANADNLCGAVTYKRGTAEEALARKSDLFLDMLLFHAYGNYQESILRELMIVFKNMLANEKLPITNRKESDKLAETWVNLIYKTSQIGYHIQPGHFHEHPSVFFIEYGKLPTLSELKNLTAKETKNNFFNSCRLSTVFDIASADLRLQTKALKLTGIQEEEASSSFDNDMQLIAARIKKLSTDFPNQKYILAMVPLGCGAFGNKIENFWGAMRNNISSLTENSELSLVIRNDNCFTFIKLASQSAMDLKFKITWETLKNIWIKLIEKHDLSQENITNLKMIIAFIKKYADDHSLTEVGQHCASELYRAYVYKFEGKNFKLITDYCTALLGKRFEFYQSLLHILSSGISNYDQHTDVKGSIVNAVQGENSYLIKLRALLEQLYTQARFELDMIYDYVARIELILHEKSVNQPDRERPSLLDKSFAMIADNLNAFKNKLHHEMPLPNKVTQYYLSKFFGKLFPDSIATQITHELNRNDVKNLSLACKFSMK